MIAVSSQARVRAQGRDAGRVPGVAPADAACRVALFTDTLADVNGVARFIRTIARVSEAAGGGLDVITSTRKARVEGPGVYTVPARGAWPLPGYPELDAVWPDGAAARRLVDRLAPDAVHVSTPGPVGLLGRRIALERGLPLVGTYHTDFPAYVEQILDDRALGWACAAWLRWFYRPFRLVLARSEGAAEGVRRTLGPRAPVDVIPPGTDVAEFNPSRRDRSMGVWASCPGARPGAVKALYAGRVSVEKNLRALARLWPAIEGAARSRGADPQLVVVGDGPYRAAMERALGPGGAAFAGVRRGPALAALVASADVLLFPSVTDTLGQAVMEAQACGLPAVVSDVGGPASVVRHGETGFVLPPPGTAAADARWVGAAAALLADAPLREAMGRAGAASMRERTIERSFAWFRAAHARAAGAPRAGAGAHEKTGPRG